MRLVKLGRVSGYLVIASGVLVLVALPMISLNVPLKLGATVTSTATLGYQILILAFILSLAMVPAMLVWSVLVAERPKMMLFALACYTVLMLVLLAYSLFVQSSTETALILQIVSVPLAILAGVANNFFFKEIKGGSLAASGGALLVIFAFIAPFSMLLALLFVAIALMFFGSCVLTIVR